jgi:hypothetical protein
MEVVCISDKVTGGGLTFGQRYDVIERGPNPNQTRFYVDSFLLINDNGVKMWYDRAPILVEVLPLSGYSIKYIGESVDGLTNGNYYEVIDKERQNEYFYFINDNNKFVGIRKINYFGGSPNFIEVTKVREDKIKELGI